jgi:hypothetical protein
MAGTGSVVRAVGRRKGAAAFEAAGRPAPRFVSYARLADDLAERLTRESHDAAPAARELAKGVHEHEAKLAPAPARAERRSIPFDAERAERAARTLTD